MQVGLLYGRPTVREYVDVNMRVVTYSTGKVESWPLNKSTRMHKRRFIVHVISSTGCANKKNNPFGKNFISPQM